MDSLSRFLEDDDDAIMTKRGYHKRENKTISNTNDKSINRSDVNT